MMTLMVAQKVTRRTAVHLFLQQTSLFSTPLLCECFLEVSSCLIESGHLEASITGGRKGHQEELEKSSFPCLWPYCRGLTGCPWCSCCCFNGTSRVQGVWRSTAGSIRHSDDDKRCVIHILLSTRLDIVSQLLSGAWQHVPSHVVLNWEFEPRVRCPNST